ncbi:MAG: YARHG domain-containing protein [Actinomycetota bacterium]|nr:YARHG domain-containing protein [Actinomycetota bacterium]
MRCSRCGGEIDRNTGYCMRCGAYHAQAVPQVQWMAQGNGAPVAAANGNKTVVAVATIIVAAIIAMTIIICTHMSSTTKADQLGAQTAATAQGSSVQPASAGATGQQSQPAAYATSVSTTTNNNNTRYITYDDDCSDARTRYVSTTTCELSPSYCSSDYILPDSSTRVYSRCELKNMSLWELYLARNEIYARYGRGFHHQDLRDYFSTKSWYHERYTPEQFESMSSPLNRVEEKNVATMLSIEKAAGSPYISR